MTRIKTSKAFMKKPAPQVSKYKKLLENTETLCTSQVYSELYSKLLKEGRLGRFIAVVQYCSIHGYDIVAAVDFIKKSMPGYVGGEDFTEKVFREMLSAHADVAQAWGYGVNGDEISDIQIKNKAISIIEKNGKMEDIQMYFDIFGKKSVDNSDNKTVVNFNLNKV